jgi:hypothetical protein
MLLATHHHVFYEFVPVAHMHEAQPMTILLDELVIGEKYELVITTDGGLWRYRIGDVVEITGLEPVHIRIAGRTKSFLNMFGEELMVHTTDEAIQAVCTQCGIQISDYVVTAIRNGDGGYHQWYIDGSVANSISGGTAHDVSVDHISQIVESYIQSHNSDYAAKRGGDLLMQPLRVTLIPSGGFHRYLASKGKTGGQHKLKRLWSDAAELEREMGEFFSPGL